MLACGTPFVAALGLRGAAVYESSRDVIRLGKSCNCRQFKLQPWFDVESLVGRTLPHEIAAHELHNKT